MNTREDHPSGFAFWEYKDKVARDNDSFVEWLDLKMSDELEFGQMIGTIPKEFTEGGVVANLLHGRQKLVLVHGFPSHIEYGVWDLDDIDEYVWSHRVVHNRLAGKDMDIGQVLEIRLVTGDFCVAMRDNGPYGFFMTKETFDRLVEYHKKISSPITKMADALEIECGDFVADYYDPDTDTIEVDGIRDMLYDHGRYISEDHRTEVINEVMKRWGY